MRRKQLDEAKQELAAKADVETEGSGLGEGFGSFDDVPSAVKERLARLERENEKLQQAVDSGYAPCSPSNALAGSQHAPPVSRLRRG